VSQLVQFGLRARKIANALLTARGRRALRYGVAATLEHQPVLRRLEPAFVVDVGANRGQFALDVLAAAPRARVLSFEPLSSEADVYRKVMSGENRVELIECGVSDESGRREMHVSGQADSSSFLAPTQLQTGLFRGTGAIASASVDVVTLDEALHDRDIPLNSLLKIDVQGHELAVLRGAADSLLRFRWVYAELSFVEFYEGQPLADEIVAHLADRGFRLVDLGRPVRHKDRAVQVDVLFEGRAPGDSDP
jgi:FkbM family methyltransferase